MIKPYRDVFYENCVYNPLLTAAKHFCGTVAPYLANDTFYRRGDRSGAGMWHRSGNLASRPTL